MRINNYFLISMLLSCFWSCKSSSVLVAQDTISTYEGYDMWTADVRSLAKDKLDNVYVLDQADIVTKYDSKLNQKFQYSNRQLGSAGCIDVTNPLQILVYYPDFQIIKTLDNNLTEMGTFDLTDLELTDVEAIGLSNDNEVWLYNEVEAKLLKVDRTGTVIVESDRMDLVFFGKAIHPTQIIERDNLVFVFDPNNGLYVFDNFGQYAYQIDRIKNGLIQFYQNQLLHIADGNIDIWNIELRIQRRMEEGQVNKAANNLIFLKNDRLMQIDDLIYKSE